MYRHARIVRIMNDAEQVIIDLFRRYVRDPGAIRRNGRMRAN